jgi:uncharacterized protein YqjF (DUF2071 family)
MIQQLLNSFMSQRWEELLLLHWPVDFNKLIDSIPSDIELDLFEGRAWISVVGFKLTQLRISPFRWVPWPAFWEINLRTYVKDRNGKKGVWFYSLDSSDLLAVTGARLLYGLPYNFAQAKGEYDSSKIAFQSNRRFPHQRATSRFEAFFPQVQNGENTANSPLDQFLLERYRFWSPRKLSNHSTSAQVNHQPYDAVITTNARYEGELFKSQGLEEPQSTPIRGHYCKGLDVEASAPSWAFLIAGQANHK